MNTLTSTVEREPTTERYTKDTKELFIRAEDLVHNEGLCVNTFWHVRERKQPLAHIKHCLMYVLKDEYNWSWIAIGKVFSLDHSTAIHAHRKVKDMLYVNDYSTTHYVNSLSKHYINDGTNTKESETKYIPCTCRTTQRP